MIRYLIIICFFISNSLFGQEVLSDLNNSPNLSKEENYFMKDKSSLVLPFIDDFSGNSSEADNNIWDVSSVLINRTYAINPPTIGVATFDGLDNEGLARDLFPPTISEPSDTLLSKEIDLSNISSGYIMFYYQSTGRGDNPEPSDSLVLEFSTDSAGIIKWHHIWSIPGDTVVRFRKKVLLITDPEYLRNNFRFRFRNYATLSGNFDHWNIDYIKIDQFNNIADTILSDIAFVYNSPSFLSRYNEMPWRHFEYFETFEILDTIDILVRNNNASISIDYQYNVYSDDGLIGHYPNSGPTRNVTILDYDSIGNFSFSSPPISVSSDIFIYSGFSDSVSFTIQHILGTNTNDYKHNDTLYRTQNFFSHFSYDDGIAESAYGINVNGAKLAYQFKLNRSDTLRAVQMYFPQMLDSVNHIPFKLTIWDHNNGPGSIIYQQEVKPVHTKYGEFHMYHLDSLLKLTGIFYVGWEQTTSDLLNIGLDRNLYANQYMYYNAGAGWTNSQFSGSWMIRPILSQAELPLFINEDIDDFLIYPNPADDQLYVKTDGDNSFLSIYDIQGVIVKQIYLRTKLDVVFIDDLSSGLYILQISNKQGRKHKRLVIR